MKTLTLILALLVGPAAYAAHTSDTHDDTPMIAAAAPLDHDCQCLTDHDCEDRMSERIQSVPDFALALRQHGDDDFSVEGEALERIQWASLEGDAEEMLQLADAIEQRAPMSAKRIALRWDDTGPMLMSPRNSMQWSRLKAERLTEFVPRIRAQIEQAIRDGSTAIAAGEWP